MPLLVATAFAQSTPGDPGPANDSAVTTGAGDGAVPLAEPVPEPAGTPEAPATASSFTGMRVAQLALVAPDGGLPRESLEPLLRTRQDQPYNPADVRLDLAMLHRALDFARVEVDVEPWVSFDDQGRPEPAVRVEYRVWPPPRIAQLRFSGNHALTVRDLLAASGMEKDDPFFADDAVKLERAVRAAYAAEGYPRAAAAVTVHPDASGHVQVAVAVTEGEPQRVTDVRVRTGDAIGDRAAKRILKGAGIAEGKPWTEARVRAARDALTRAIRKRGWYAARVGVRMDSLTTETDRIAFLVDPRARWSVESEGKNLPHPRAVVKQLGLEDAPRLGRTFAEEASDTLTQQLRQRGYLEANVKVDVTEAPTEGTIRVTGDAGARHRLRRVVFEGEPIWSQKYLEQALREASPDMLDQHRVTPEAMDQALVVLQEFYRSQGYLSAKLTRLDFVEGTGHSVVPVDVRVRVDPGPRATLAAVEVPEPVPGITAAGFFSDLEGNPLNPAEIDARCRKLVEALNEQGYLSADARAQTTLSADGREARVAIDVTPGPVVYLRTVVMRGYRRTRRSVLEREVDVHTGDPLSPSKITALRRRLYELDVFKQVSTELVGDEDRAKDLFIEVEEKPNLHFEVGGGVATDQGIKVFTRAGHRNLFGLGHRLTLYGQVGLGWVGDGWVPDWLAPEWKVAAHYEAPHIPGRGERVAADVLFNEQQQEPTFRLERSGGGLGVLLRVGAHGTAELAYHVQARKLLDIDPGALVQQDPWWDELQVSDAQDPQPVLPSDVRFQSGMDLSFLYDRRDDPFNPTSGGLVNVSVTATDKVLSDVSFLKGEASWTQWVPVAGFGLQLRLRGGAAWLPGEGTTLPIEDRFFLGGGANLRGFALDSVGPANEVSAEHIDYPDAIGPIIDYANRDAAPRWVPTGGDALGLASLEFRIPFEKLGLTRWSGTQLAFFTDVGNVWFLAPEVRTDSMADANEPDLRWSVGVGLRRATVIGPVQVDLGFNPARMADRDEDLVRVHVSLGAL